MSDNTNGYVRWGPLVGILVGIGVANVGANFGVITWAQSAHSEQPHKGAVRQHEFDRVIQTLRADMREIRGDTREILKVISPQKD